MRRELERIEIPGEHDARVRTWDTVRAAYEDREPVARGFPLRLVAVALAAAAVIAAAVSPPGRAVFDRVLEEDRTPALRLPDGGRLIVKSSVGPWIIRADGSKRLLGAYREATWSPRGLFVAVTRGNELAALEPTGKPRWTISQPRPRFPRWSPSGFRIAYVSRGNLRVVVGDGTGDRPVAVSAFVAPAWRPGPAHVLVYARRDGRVVAINPDTGRELWRTRPGAAVRKLEWSSDARRLIVIRGREVEILRSGGQTSTGIRVPRGRVDDATFRPGSHAIAYSYGSRVALIAEGGGVLFAGRGPFDSLTWSPDRQWLLIRWRSAGQWLFVRATGKPRVIAVSRVDAIFGSTTLPAPVGWCCP